MNYTAHKAIMFQDRSISYILSSLTFVKWILWETGGAIRGWEKEHWKQIHLVEQCQHHSDFIFTKTKSCFQLQHIHIHHQFEPCIFWQWQETFCRQDQEICPWQLHMILSSNILCLIVLAWYRIFEYWLSLAILPLQLFLWSLLYAGPKMDFWKQVCMHMLLFSCFLIINMLCTSLCYKQWQNSTTNS